MDELMNGTADAGAEEIAAPSLEQILGETMTAAYDKAEGVETAEPAAESAATRDASGRFVSTKPAEASADTATPAEEKTETTDQPAKAEGAPAEPASGPPQSWSAAAKAEWDKASPVLKAEIAKREADVQKGFEQKAAETRPHVEFAQQVRQRFEPFRQEMAARGVSEVQAIDYLVSMEQAARRDPESYIRHVAQELKVDLGRLTGSPARAADPAQAEYVDPQLADLRKAVNGLVQEKQTERQAAQTRLMTEAQGAIEAFSKDPANKHFDAVKTTMARMMQTGEATDLKGAYEKAIWANPDIRNALLAEQRAADEAQRAKERDEAAKKARRAGGTPLVPRGAAATRGSGPKSMDQTMSEAFDRIAGAA